MRFFLRLCVFGLFLYFFLMEAAARRALMVLPALLPGAVCTLWRMAGAHPRAAHKPENDIK